ncbi:amino acid adenylation domain-containing protein [Plectonema radiosum NIES-515]|uniref:Amino acid adenylation domain-containing protein n=1 Tax=Plectonema radiosum NIES-515 TaxID=2986073 RepID=A0ABT3B5I8_9CYAN|nr:non-ribosomal peptide synthetase [Plectonema radiosum]MCV3216658.1 amino acid adenylation domain-containing protein [Plectonema radiosum NIES-515]
MNLHSLLTDLSHRGVKLSANGNSLDIDAPKGVITPELRDSLAKHKAELLTLLQQNGTSTTSLPKIEPAPESRYEPFPLTDMQYAFWVGRSGVLELGNVANHGYYEIECKYLHIEQLNVALQKVIERHDMLRAIVLPNGQQQVLKQVPFYTIETLDLRDKTEDIANAELDAVRQRMSHQVIPSDRWPLFEFRVTRLAEESFRLHVSFDLQIFDAWSLFRLFDEWFQLYQHPEELLPPLEISFRDYVLAEQSIEQTELYKRSQAYWFNRLDELSPAPDLPLAKSPKEIKHHQNKRYEGRLEPTQWQQLKQRAANAGLTPSGVLLAAFTEILTLWSKSPRFTLNLALFNRLPLHPQVNDILGDFTSVTLLTVDNSQPEAFRERSRRLQQQLLQDLEHRYISGVRVTRELARRQGTAPSAMPIVFTSTLGFSSLGQETLTFSHFGDLVYGISQASQAWMDIQVWEEKETLTCNWDVVEELFPTGLISDMFEAYFSLLKQLATSESAWLNTNRQLIPPLQLAQRDRINATTVPTPDAMLHTMFAQQAQQRKTAPAIISSQCTLTYQELYTLSNQLGHRLQRLGATPNQLIGVVMDKGWEQIVAVMGILASGAAYVPIDPNLPQQRRDYLLANSEVKIVLTQSWLDEKLDWLSGIQRLCINTQELAKESHEPLQSAQTPDDLAYVIYTSGSTGLPKGVMISDRNVVNVVIHTNQRFNIGCQDRILAVTALNHDLSVYDIFGLLCAGGAIVIPDACGVKDPAHWAELMVREKVTLWNSVPAMMQMLVEYAESQSVVIPASLRLVIMGGDWLPVSLPERLRILVPKVEILSIGGPTETTIWNIGYLITEVDPNWKSIPYGQPMANAKYYILNEALEDCPVWVPGQMYCASVQVAQGYWRDAEKTAAKFITHPRTQERIYCTGDLGRYLPDGNIEFLGRADFQVKIRGYRIELGEIEAAIKQHPGVKEAIAVTIPGVEQSHQQIIACIVPNQQQAETLFELERVDSGETQQLWQNLVKKGAKIAQQNLDAVKPEVFAAFWQQYLDPLYTYAVSIAFHQFGVYTQLHEGYSLDELMQRGQIKPRYRQWLSRALSFLVDLGWLEVRSDKFINTRLLPNSFPTELLAKILSEAAPILDYNQNTVQLLVNSARNLAAILTENIHSAQIIATDEIPALYRKEFQAGSLVIREILHHLAQSWDSKTNLRILEIGAGTGAVTREILPVLPPEKTTYVYTDISQYFLQLGQQDFGHYPFLETALFNLEQSPQEQGYELHSFDVIIAGGVIHATRDIKESLDNMRSLLAPNGLLLFVEPTKLHPFWELFMGLQQGFDRFEDTSLRSHPLLSPKQWQEVLIAQGFTDCTVFNQPGSIADFLAVYTFMARGSASVQKFKKQEIRSFLQQKLPDYMIPSEFMLLDALPLTANGKVNRQNLRSAFGGNASLSQCKTNYVTPQTETEQIIASIWQEVLRVEKVGINDKFFELGGDSLQATQVIARMREKFPVNLPVQNLLQAPTLSSLAKSIDEIQQTTQKLQAPIHEALDNRVEVEL